MRENPATVERCGTRNASGRYPYSLTVEQLDAILRDRAMYRRRSVHLVGL